MYTGLSDTVDSPVEVATPEPPWWNLAAVEERLLERRPRDNKIIVPTIVIDVDTGGHLSKVSEPRAIEHAGVAWAHLARVVAVRDVAMMVKRRPVRGVVLLGCPERTRRSRVDFMIPASPH